MDTPHLYWSNPNISVWENFVYTGDSIKLGEARTFTIDLVRQANARLRERASSRRRRFALPKGRRLPDAVSMPKTVRYHIPYSGKSAYT